MKTNIAHLDRAIRVGLGLFLVATPILNLRTYPYNLFGLVLIATALVGYCPLYSIVSWLLPKRAPSHGGRLGPPHASTTG